MTLYDTARDLRDLIEAEADTIENAGTMSDPVVDALDNAGLFNFMTPRSVGGHEAAPSEIFDVCEELSYADGSVGWAFTQNASVGAYLAFVNPPHRQKTCRPTRRRRHVRTPGHRPPNRRRIHSLRQLQIR